MMLAGGLAFACSSTTEVVPPPAPPPPTLLVTNATCDSGPCRTVWLDAFIWGWHIPQPPTGIRELGLVRGQATCLQFPAKWTIDTGTTVGDSVVNDSVLVWTPDQPEGVFLFAEDSAFNADVVNGTVTQAQLDSSQEGVWPYAPVGPGSVGITSTFVPGASPGWRMTVPGSTTDRRTPIVPQPAPACTP